MAGILFAIGVVLVIGGAFSDVSLLLNPSYAMLYGGLDPLAVWSVVGLVGIGLIIMD
jgi:hypothetical protein